MAVFGTTDIPGDEITVNSGGTVQISAAFSRTLGLVGGMDTANGSASDDGSVVEVTSSADAASQFGENSELKRLVDLAFAQSSPPTTIYAAPVSETSVTNEGVTQSDTLANSPIFDPNIHPDHSVSVSDTGGTDPTVNIVYDDPPSTPSGTDQANLNPRTGDIEFDAAAAGSYEIDYDYGASGDYDTAIQNVVDKAPRFIFVGTETESFGNSLLTEMNSKSQDFTFMHGMIGAPPETTPGSYSDSLDDRRIAVVAPSRGYTDSDNTEARVGGAAAAKQAGKALGDSTTYESLAGFVDLRTVHTNSELGSFVDKQVYPVKKGDSIFVVKDMTTSTDSKFERIYASEITDESISISHSISQEFIGDLNIESNRFALGESHTSSYQEMVDDNLLDAASVEVSEGANADEVDVNIGLNIVDVIDTINATITVGDVITNGGAS